MTEPTDKQINDAIAELCGYPTTPFIGLARDPEGKGGKYFCGEKAGKIKTVFVTSARPDILPMCKYRFFLPCTDRNLLPEVMATVDTHKAKRAFAEQFTLLRDYEETDNPVIHWKDMWELLTLSPREVCIAALKACGKRRALEKEAKDG